MKNSRYYVTVSQDTRGWYAVLMFGVQPMDIGVGGPHATRDGAEQEGREWAATEGVEFHP